MHYVIGEEGCLKDKVGTLVYDVRSSDINDPKKYPQFTKLRKRFEVEQNSGEIIFVPSGWHHQVHNMVISKIYTNYLKRLVISIKE